MVLPKIKRHLNEKKNTLSDNDSIHGHRNSNKTERSIIARHRNFNPPKNCKITVHDSSPHPIFQAVRTPFPHQLLCIAAMSIGTVCAGGGAWIYHTSCALHYRWPSVAPLATMFYHRLSDKLAEKWDCHFPNALTLV